MAHLNKVEIRRFKRLEHLIIDLDQTNVLIGANNAGKRCRVPGTPCLTPWANSGKSGRELALRLMASGRPPGAGGVECLRPRENVQ